MEIVFQLENQIIARTDRNVLAAKSKNYVQARFELLSDDWTAPITAIFDEYTVVLDEDNRCIVPWEVLQEPGVFRVSAFCGDLHTASEVRVPVTETGYQPGQTPVPPTPSVYSQLTQMVQDAVDSVKDIEADAMQSKQAAQSAAVSAQNSAASAEEAAATAAQQAETASAAVELTTQKVQEAASCAESAAEFAQEARDAAASVPLIDDTQAGLTNPWSGAKTEEEIGAVAMELDKLSQTVDIILGKDAPATFAQIRFAVEQGRASEYFAVGDQLKPNWKNGSVNYEDPFDIVQLNRTYELETGDTINGMLIQQHYANVKNCPFDAQEALYDADEELPAGTYHFTVAGDTWLESENGKVIQFTLTKPVPAGGQLVYANPEAYDEMLAGQTIDVFSSPTSFVPIESVVLSEGSEGVDLGVTDGQGKLNHHQRAYRGYNRWKTSMLRQYLNSDKPAGQWWSKQNKWDRASVFVNSNPGFLSGFDSDFLETIRPVKVQTALDASSSGGSDITYDRFFLASLEQMNIVPEITGAEGEALSYWKEIAGEDPSGNLDNGRFKKNYTYSSLKTFGLQTKTTAVTYFLRSVSVANRCNLWRVYLSGNIGETAAYYGYYCVPACVIG